MEFTCECGCKDFHVFMKYKSLYKSRFRCLNCDKTYQQDYNEIKEIDMKKMWKEVMKHI